MKEIYVFLFVCSCLIAYHPEASGQAFSNTGEPWKSSDVFHSNVFIKNSGQFNSWAKTRSPVLFAVNNSDKIFFTQTGVTFRIDKPDTRSEAEREMEEHRDRKKEHAAESKTCFIRMSWEGCNPDALLQADEETSNYYTFGEKGFENLQARGYKKLTYKNIYNGIDVEYVIPDKGGIKYSLILHPGADRKKIKMKYSGDIEGILKDINGNIVINTPAGAITDHAPQSFYEGGEKIISTFELSQSTVAFALDIPPSSIFHQPLAIIIDPWTTTPTSLTTNNVALNIDYDNFGNVFVSGGTLSYKLAKYSPGGTLLWTYTTLAGWGNGWNTYSKFCVIPQTGTTFMGEAEASGGSAKVAKINSAGAQVFLTPPLSGNPEIWLMLYNRCTQKLIGFGGGTSTPANMQILSDTNLTSNISQCFNSSTVAFNDIADVEMDFNGDFYALVSSWAMFNNPDRNHLQKSPISSGYTPPLAWDVNSTYDFSEEGNTALTGLSFGSGSLVSVRANILALNTKYLYSYDGKTIIAWNKASGANLGSVIVNAAYTPGKDRAYEGIAVDECDNVYVGGLNQVHVYSFNGSTFTAQASITTNIPAAVYDVELSRATNTLYVCGPNFVTVTPALNCFANPLAVTTNSNPCTGTASASASGGTPPYTYIWSNGATTSSVSGLTSGTYTVLVSDGSCIGQATMDTVVFKPTVELTATATPTSCGNNNGTATTSVSAGSAPFTYSWSSGQTTAGASNLPTGVYTVTVTDNNGCANSVTVAVSTSGALTMTTTTTSSGCSVANGTATVNASSGVPPYSFFWNNGQTSQTATGLAAGTYTVTVTDASGCSAITTATVTQPSNINAISAAVADTCSKGVGGAAAMAAGGIAPYTYLWNNGQSTSAATNLAAGNYTCTVTDANGCSVSTVVSVPNSGGANANAGVDISITAGDSTNLTASGGVNYSWSTGATSNQINVSPTITTSYVVAVTNANGCTDVDTVIVYVTEPVVDCSEAENPDLFALPNAFSPNSDNQNDRFHLLYGQLLIDCVKEFYIAVYNRWGEKIYEGTAIDFSWDGLLKDKSENSATFAWYMRAVLTNDVEVKKKGNVTLLH